MRTFVMLGGCLLTVSILWNALECVVFPRSKSATSHPTPRRYHRMTWRLWKACARSIRPGHRERFLSLYGPLSFAMLLALWAAGLIAGFALMHWSQSAIASDLPGDGQFFDDFYLSGTSFFTLGFGDVVPHNEASRFVAVAEAGIGLMFVTALLGYMPVLYGSIVRRERRVTLLPGWAGSPPTAAEILRRLGRANALPNLQEFLHEWEVWCAGVRHSHLSHPGISYFRSQDEDQSWIAALAVVLDVSALARIGIDGSPVWRAQLTFDIARRTVVDLAGVLGIEPDYSIERVRPGDLARLRRGLADCGVTLSASINAEREFGDLRALYEPHLVALSKYFMVSIPPWLL